MQLRLAPWIFCGIFLASSGCSSDEVGATSPATLDASSDGPALDAPEYDVLGTDGPVGWPEGGQDVVGMEAEPVETGPDADLDAAHEASSDAVADVQADGGTPPFEIFVSTAGDDANDGSTPAKSVRTLERVHAVLKAAAPDRDVEVRIEQGTYAGQTVNWTYYHPARTITFMPVDYDGGGINSIAGRPVFDGEGAGALLTLNASNGERTNLSFVYLQIEGYRTYGLLFRGDRDDFEHGWNGYNRVFGCILTRIGNLASAGAAGYGGLDLVNSRNNEIRNNHFLQVENESSSAGLMHAIYLAHGSRGNQVRANRFVGISGDPIRVRDGSSSNEVIDNTFEEAGSSAFISDWWCDKSVNSACTKASGECPSWENAFRDNELHCGYAGTNIDTFRYFQGESYVPSWCVDHASVDGWARLRTSGNAKTCP